MTLPSNYRCKPYMDIGDPMPEIGARVYRIESAPGTCLTGNVVAYVPYQRAVLVKWDHLPEPVSVKVQHIALVS